MRTFALLAGGWLLFALAAALLQAVGLERFRPDLLAVLVFHTAITRPWTYGLLSAAALGLLYAPFHQCAPWVFVLQAFLFFAALRGLARYLNLSGLLPGTLFVFFGEVVLQFLLLLTTDLAGSDSWTFSGFTLRSLPIALTTAILAPGLHRFFLRIEQRLWPHRRDVFC